MKGMLYFTLFFALAFNVYFLVSTPKNVEQVKEDSTQQGLSRDIAQIIEHSDVFKEEFDVFLRLLNQKKWREAVDFYRINYVDFLQMRNVTVVNHPLKNQMLLTMQYLMADDEIDHLSTLSNYLLVWYPKEIEFIQFKMMTFIQRGKVSQAVDVYFLEYEKMSGQSEKQFFAQSFETWLDKQLIVWHTNDHDDVAQLVWEKLIKYDETHVKWNVQLAQILVWQNKFKQAKRVIEPYQFEWDFQDDINQIMAEISVNYNANESIDLEKEGAHFLVDSVFTDNGLSPDQAKVKLLIDTGASFTVIGQKVFDDHFLYVDKKTVGRVTANTANGEVEAQMYEVYEMKIGDYSVNNIRFIVLDLNDENSSAQGLLGMNFLKYFKFNIDQNSSVLTLSY